MHSDTTSAGKLTTQRFLALHPRRFDPCTFFGLKDYLRPGGLQDVNMDYYRERGYVGRRVTLIGKAHQGYSLDMRQHRYDSYFLDFIMQSNDHRSLNRLFSTAKLWHRAAPSVDKLVEGLFSFEKEWIEPLDLLSDKSLRVAISAARKAFSLDSKLRPITIASSLSQLQGSSSAGFPFSGKKRDNLGDAYAATAHWARKLGRDSSSYMDLPPVRMAMRTQVSVATKDKVRFVWGYPMPVTALEGTFAIPLLQAYNARAHPMVTGIHVHRDLPGIYRNFEGLLVATDVSSFDTSVIPYFVNVAFSIIHDNFENLTREEETVLDSLRQYFIHTPVMCPDGTLFRKHSGVPSGSFFTQLVDSIVNYLMVVYIMHGSTGCVVDPYVLGDDSITSIPLKFKVSFEDLSTRAARLGFTLSKEKTKIGTDPSQVPFLGRYVRHGATYRPIFDMFCSMLYPEGRVFSKEHSLSRCLMLLLDSGLTNVIWDGLYRKYLDWCKFELSSQPVSFNFKKSSFSARDVREFLRFEVGFSDADEGLDPSILENEIYWLAALRL